MFILLKMSQYKSEEEVNVLYLAQNIRFTSLTDRANDFFIFSVEIMSCTSKKLVWTQLFYFYHTFFFFLSQLARPCDWSQTFNQGLIDLFQEKHWKHIFELNFLRGSLRVHIRSDVFPHPRILHRSLSSTQAGQVGRCPVSRVSDRYDGGGEAASAPRASA